MLIATVSVRGDFAYVYDEGGRTIGTISMRGGVLSRYTSNSVSIKIGSFIYVYDEREPNIKTIPA